MLETWRAGGMKEAFLELKAHLDRKENTVLSFKARPGVSYSLRGGLEAGQGFQRPLYVMIDVVDDDTENRWLSVCFYGDMISDHEEMGDLIPGGLLGEDGYCFDLMDDDGDTVAYLEDRVTEAHGKAMGA